MQPLDSTPMLADASEDSDPTTPAAKKPKRSSRSENQPPALRAPSKCFWISSIQEMPIYDHTPWDFYEPYLTLGPDRTLALCNHETQSRVIRTCLAKVSQHHWSPISRSLISRIEHRNFINYYEIYLSEGQGFLISEYIEYSLKDILPRGIYPTEPEVAYIISQVLAGIQFIRSNRLQDSTISKRTVWISRGGNVKIDPTLSPVDDEQTSADVSSLGALMLALLNEPRGALKSTAWSPEAVDFIEATSWATPDELSQHIFLAGSAGPKPLEALCMACSLMIERNVHPVGAFSERFNRLVQLRLHNSARKLPDKQSCHDHLPHFSGEPLELGKCSANARPQSPTPVNGVPAMARRSEDEQLLEQSRWIDRAGLVRDADCPQKFMNTSAEALTLTNTLLSVIRLQRHLGARIIISTQEPTISPILLDLCSITIAHRFTSPEWMASLKSHVAAVAANSICAEIDGDGQEMVSESRRWVGRSVPKLFDQIVRLGVGEALLFAPTAIIGVRQGDTGRKTLGSGYLNIRVRNRLTTDGGRSVMAT